jgi:hypothetical protein
VTRVRAAIAVGLALIGIGLAATLLRTEEPFLADNGREVQLPAFVVIPAGAQACEPETSIPQGAGAVAFSVVSAGQQAGPLAVTVSSAGRTLGSGTTSSGLVNSTVHVRLGSGVGGARSARFCVANRGSRQVAVAGQEVPFGSGAHVSDPRQPQTRAMRLEWFEPNAVTQLSRAGVIARRYGFAKASWVGTWTFWVALVVLLTASAAGIAMVARETSRAAEA